MAVEVGRLNLDCQKCSDQQKVLRGCEKDFSGTWLGVFDGLTRCPKRIVKADNYQYIGAYNKYMKGILMNKGNWFDQPAKLNEAFDVIEFQIAKEDK